ncbi:20009_t:CDS:1 [Entrophospora sp. SA101]|nr:11525_t:CDS:1 [Entrophospora sp. SA101]CAJ0747086.1 20009_t:CDS:1 [Entrophospora sp. SA101]CAJ0836395.1 2088_t:CDS:1 [Entrophospora sp. SA101]CAJ0916963.1 155_t:CDS:1 [Entrophospora sp. SA101]
MDSQAIQVNSARELKSLEQTQFNLFLNANLTLKKEVEEYLKKQEKILVNGEEGIRDEVIQKLLAMFMEFTKNIIFNQERVKKVENQGKITARDLDDQLHQANLFN